MSLHHFKFPPSRFGSDLQKENSIEWEEKKPNCSLKVNSITIQKTSENVFKIVIFNMKVTAESVISEMMSLFYS